jgi:1-acyl-sn-glycerol-3-phosphate acyltransferase
MEQDRFAGIRPYRDSEVRAVLDRLLADDELLAAISRLRFPRASRCCGSLLRPLLRLVLRRQLAGVNSVRGFQHVVEKYMTRMIRSTTTAFSVSGLDRLDAGRACLFIGNHRDIALDPAFVNYALYYSGRDTVRIAIGDNLLTRDYASELMRLNKSFIVKRSAKGPRQMLAAYRELSDYILHSLVVENSSIWIAQREGRAKDGWDRTEPAIVKMLCMSKPKDTPLSDHVVALNIVPVAISYEWDPCDAAKARELHERATHGSYQKGEHEDVASIATSITSPKGAVHVSFGEPLGGALETAEAVAAEIDRQVLRMYRLQPSNLCAYKMLRGTLPDGCSSDADLAACEASFRARLAAVPEAHREFLINMYANPILNRIALEAARP